MTTRQTSARAGRRSRILAGIVALVVVLLAGFPAQAGEPLVSAVESVGMTVSDLGRSVRFFTEVLGFEQVAEAEVLGSRYEHLLGVFGLRIRWAQLRLGDEQIELTEYLTPRGRPIPGDARSNDLWFQHIAIVVRDMDEAYRRLRAHGVRHVSSAPQRLPDWNPAAGGIEAFYFQDADGHNLELIYFPPGKGDPRWQEPGDEIFLGIDHTAIAVADTDRSLVYYRDTLGLGVAGESLNYGTEQEHLNNVFGARVRITGLRTAAGPGIEFLEYLAPRTGRATPRDLAANDLAHWQTRLRVTGVDQAHRSLASSAGRPVSSAPESFPGTELGFGEALLVRDPDGHGLLLVDR